MTVHVTSAQRYARLTDINTDDMLRAIGRDKQRANPALRALFRPHAKRFTRMLMAYDDIVGKRGMAAGSRFVLNQFNAKVTVHGAPNMDTTRPTLYLANHPGLTDTVSLFAKLPRPDYKIIAADNPFLACLPNVSHELITVDLNGNDNFAPLRGAIDHLKQGGALVTFPAGKIEPDPAVADGAVESLDQWVNMDVFGRLVPDCVVVPILIAGVFNGRARHHPLVRLRQTADDQAWSAAILQLTFPKRYPVTPHIHVGDPIDLRKYPRRTPISPLIRTRMEQLIVLNYPHETRQGGIRLLPN